MCSRQMGRLRLALSFSEGAGGAGDAEGAVRDARSGSASSRLPRLAVTMGDPAGVGPEVALRALNDPELDATCEPLLVGDAGSLEQWAGMLSLPLPDGLVDVGANLGEVTPGLPTADGALAALQSIETAANLCLGGEADAMVTGPVSKAAISETGNAFTGHTEFLADLTGAENVVMTFVHGSRRVGLATTHLSLAEVPAALTVDLVVGKLAALSRGLTEWFGVESPRIAVTGLNPHAGEDGRTGDEEQRVIAPAIAEAVRDGVLAEGPFPADSIFCGHGDPNACGPGSRFDAILTMYHDQGTIAAKLWGFDECVNLSIGLPIVRTSVDHGTAFDHAGGANVNPGSMKAAIRVAAAIARRLAESP